MSDDLVKRLREGVRTGSAALPRAIERLTLAREQNSRIDDLHPGALNMPSEISMQKAEGITGPCTCHEAYTGRGRIDPGCQYHLHAEDIAQALDERARECAEIARDDDGHFTVWGEDRNTRVSQNTARQISEAIASRFSLKPKG